VAIAVHLITPFSARIPETLSSVPNIHIRTFDGGIQYPNALSYGIDQQAVLSVQVAAGGDQSDTIYFSPFYWQQYVVDPHIDDPLGFDDDEDEEEEDDD
jgi:hypothetical protein